MDVGVPAPYRAHGGAVSQIAGSRKTGRVVVLETKGDQLDNLDTAYKRQVLDVLSDSFAWDTTVPAGTLALVQETGETVECELVLFGDLPTQLPERIAKPKRKRKVS